MTLKISAPSDYLAAESRADRPLPRSRGNFLIWYQTMVLGAALGAIYSNLPIYAYVLSPALLPKFFYFGIVFAITPLILLKFHAFSAYLLSPFALWASLLLLLNLVHFAGLSMGGGWGATYIIGHHIDAREALVATRIQYILFSIFLGFAAYTSSHTKYLKPVVCLMVALPVAVLLDFARPGLLYPIETEGAVLGRAAAMFINPTMAGEAVLTVFLIGCAVLGIRNRVPLFFLSGAAVIATFSRSSIIAWVLIMLILTVKRSLPKSAVITAALVLGLSVIFLSSFENYLDSRRELEAASSNILSRLDFFSSFKFDDDSSEERAAVIRGGWELFLQNPVFGAGAGATQFWAHRGSTHNQLLLLAAEYGIFGISMWVWLVIILWKGRFFKERGLQLAMVFLFVFMSMFTHQMLDAASYWLATAALISIRKKAGQLPPDRGR